MLALKERCAGVTRPGLPSQARVLNLCVGARNNHAAHDALRSLIRRGRLSVKREKAQVTMPKADDAAFRADVTLSASLVSVTSSRTQGAFCQYLVVKDLFGLLVRGFCLIVDRLKIGRNMRTTDFACPWYFAIKLFEYFPGQLARARTLARRRPLAVGCHSCRTRGEACPQARRPCGTHSRGRPCRRRCS